MTQNRIEFHSTLEFLSKDCKSQNHSSCSHQWEGFGFNVICICNCHKEIDKKNIVLDEPCKHSNTYCRNPIFNLTAEADDQI